MAQLPQLPQLPTIDFTKLDAAKAVDTVTNVLRDGAYITIGLGVLGAQQAAEMAKSASVKVQDATKKAQDLSKQYADTMQHAGEQARTATETFTKQVRGLVGSAA
jgi:methionine aminopeptidase